MRHLYLLLVFAIGLLAGPQAFAGQYHMAAAPQAEQAADMSRQDLRAARKALRQELRQAQPAADNDELLILVATILIPPLGVFLFENNEFTNRVLISLILTIFFWFPGLIYSLLVVLGVI